MDCRQPLSNVGGHRFARDYFRVGRDSGAMFGLNRELVNARRFSGGNSIAQRSNADFPKGLWSIFAALWFPN